VLRLDSVPDGRWLCTGCGGADAASGVAATCAQCSVVHPPLLVADGEQLGWARSVAYLGVIHTDDCSLDAELSHRIQLARGATRRLRPLLFGGRPQRHLRRHFGGVFRALVHSVLLYGSEVWALSTAQLEQLEAVVRACLRQALPRYERTDPRYVLRNRFLLATMMARRQAAWLGHLARMEPERLQLQMLAGRLVVPGQGAAGCRGASLMGVHGSTGAWRQLIDRYLTWEARRTHFGGRRGQWWELAQSRADWRSFVRSIRAYASELVQPSCPLVANTH